MGMDSVEIILRIEEDFAISISDEEAATVVTAGDLHNLILRKLETAPSFRPARAFFRLRAAIVHVLDRPRRTIGVHTKLAHLLPRPTRIAAWASMEEVSGLLFPELRHPRWLRDTIRIAAGSAGLAVLVGLASWSHPVGLFWLPLVASSAFAGFVAMVGLYRLTSFLAWDLPMRTVGELAQQLTGLNPDAFAMDGELLSPADVWQRLAAILVDQLGLNWEQIHPNSRFVEDLGVD
jgi:acyl carrier protein